jgi:iron complex outermembrane receptor protein
MLDIGRRLSFSAGAARQLLAGSCLAGVVAFAQPVLAQDDAAQSSDHGIGEIVVTARYVEESVQDTPIAISAQTDEQLEAANVTNISTLGAVIPNLQTVPGHSFSAGTPIISLRGVQQGASSSLAVPPAVAIYTDDVYHSTTAGSELDFTDVVRVEVNRGPQSTLNGNASIGGSIKLFTQDPKGDGSGFVTLGYGSRNHMEAAGAIDIGISPTLAIRAFAHFDRQTGFQNRLDFTCMMDKLGTPELAGTLPYFQPDSGKKDCVIGHNGGGESAVGQVKLKWTPTDDVSLLLTARHRRENLEETPTVTTLFQPACVQPVPGYPNGIGPQPCTAPASNQTYNLAAYNTFGILEDNRFIVPERNGHLYDMYGTYCRPLLDISGNVGTGAFTPGYPVGVCYDPRKTSDHTLLSAKLEADLTENVSMTAIGGYTKYNNEFTQNDDASPLAALFSHFHNIDEMYSGELRFNGKAFNDKLQWVVGGFTVKTDGYQNNMISFVTVYQLNSVHGVNKSSSGFAHLDYNITDAWRISGGGRYTHTDISITIDNPQAVTIIDPVHSSQNRWDWLISTDYMINDDVMIYASAASGSRPPGLTTILNTGRQLSPTSAEELISFETGIKADLLDRRLRTNITAFYMDYKKLATSVQGTECKNQPGDTAIWHDANANTSAGVDICKQYPGVPDPINFFNNVGIPAKVKGVEWEITAIPVDGLRIDWSGGYNKFTSGVAVPLPGSLFPGNLRQPEWNMHANISYDIETGVGTFTPRVDWNWQSRQTWDPGPNAHAPAQEFIIDPYSLWNAQIQYKSPDRDWTAALQVTNLADLYYHYQNRLLGGVNYVSRIGAPREWKLSIRKEF